MIHNAGLESGARVTVSQENISDIPGLIDLCAEYRVGDFAFTRYAPNGGDKNSIAPTVLSWCAGGLKAAYRAIYFLTA